MAVLMQPFAEQPVPMQPSNARGRYDDRLTAESQMLCCTMLSADYNQIAQIGWSVHDTGHSRHLKCLLAHAASPQCRIDAAAPSFVLLQAAAADAPMPQYSGDFIRRRLVVFVSIVLG